MACDYTKQGHEGGGLDIDSVATTIRVLVRLLTQREVYLVTQVLLLGSIRLVLLRLWRHNMILHPPLVRCPGLGRCLDIAADVFAVLTNMIAQAVVLAVTHVSDSYQQQRVGHAVP